MKCRERTALGRSGRQTRAYHVMTEEPVSNKQGTGKHSELPGHARLLLELEAKWWSQQSSGRGTKSQVPIGHCHLV